MTLPAAYLLAELSARGVEVRAEGGDLRLRPASACADLLPALREQKLELLALLSLPLADRALQILARDGRHTTKSLALALGRPRDGELHAVLSEVLRRTATGGDCGGSNLWREGDGTR